MCCYQVQCDPFFQRFQRQTKVLRSASFSKHSSWSSSTPSHPSSTWLSSEEGKTAPSPASLFWLLSLTGLLIQLKALQHQHQTGFPLHSKVSDWCLFCPQTGWETWKVSVCGWLLQDGGGNSLYPHGVCWDVYTKWSNNQICSSSPSCCCRFYLLSLMN